MNYDGAAPNSGQTMTPDAPPPGSVISDRFLLEGRLGGGGLGDLFRAHDQKSGKQVAVRLLAADLTRSEVVADQLRAQVQASTTLSQKNIVRVYGMGQAQSRHYIAMEFVEGQSLRTLLERKRQAGKTFSLKGAYNVLAHVCNALHHAHQTMWHGLPGPGAILINQAGRVKVAEFGIVGALTPGSGSVARLGDAYCLAPEMHSDPAASGPASDIYALGVVLHEMLTGQPPANPPEPITNLVAGLPRDAEAVIWRCLQPNPADRFADVQQLKAAFYAAIEGHQDFASERIQTAGAASQATPTPATAIPVQPKPAAPAMQQPPQQSPAMQQPPQQSPAMHQPPQQSPAMPPRRAPAPPVSQPPSVQPQATGLGMQQGSPLQPSPSRQVSIEDLLAEADADTNERWLIQKDRLDFGPFSMGGLKRSLYKGEFSGDDMLVDQETGHRTTVRQHAAFADFMRHLDRHLAIQQAEQTEVRQRAESRKHRTLLISMMVAGILILVVGGVIAAYMLTRDPEIREKIVYRESKPMAGLKGIDVQWKAEPADQAKHRRSLHKRRRRNRRSTGDDNITRFGDATKDGGDALLSESVVQNVMRSNFGKLSPCVQKEWMRNRALRNVAIDFGIQGSGRVSFVKVNGKSSGPFHSCVSSRMRSIVFPKFDGTLTRASFSMSLKL